MAKTCITEKSAARQKWIENGLLELMLERKFDDIAVTELCRHLDLSRRSFYRYFSDIEDVLDSLMNRTFQEMAIIRASMTLPALERDYEFWLERRKLLSALAYSGMYSKLAEYALKYSEPEALKTYLSAADSEQNLSREINLFAVTGLTSLLISWHAEGFQKTPAQMAWIAHRMLCEPLLNNS